MLSLEVQAATISANFIVKKLGTACSAPGSTQSTASARSISGGLKSFMFVSATTSTKHLESAGNSCKKAVKLSNLYYSLLFINSFTICHYCYIFASLLLILKISHSVSKTYFLIFEFFNTNFSN